MKLYMSKDLFFAATQAEAQTHQRETGSPFTQLELPPDGGRQGFAKFLNDTVAEARFGDAGMDATAAPDEIEPTTVSSPVTGTVTPETRRQWDAESIVDFILDDATVAQAENILSTLATRVKEALKGRGHGS